MNEQGFDKLLRQSMDAERDIPFKESAWAALTEQLDDDSSKGFVFPWWGILPILFIGLIGWNVYLQQQLSTSKIELEDLNSRLEVMAVDTVFKKTVETRIDTLIIKEKIYIPINEANPVKEEKNNSSTLQSIQQSLNTTLDKNQQLEQIIEVPIEFLNANPNEVETKVEEVTTPAPIEEKVYANFLESLELDLSNNELPSLEEVKINTPKTPLFSLAIGTQFGSLYQAQNFNNQSYGISLNAYYKKTWQLGVGIEQWSFNPNSSTLFSNRANSELYPGLDQFVYVNEDVFETSSSKFISIPYYINYNFNAGKRWRPYVGIGGVYNNAKESVLMITNDIPSNSTVSSYQASPELLPSYLLTGGINFGINYEYNEKLRFGIHQTGYYNFGLENYLLTENKYMLQTKIGVMYNVGRR